MCLLVYEGDGSGGHAETAPVGGCNTTVNADTGEDARRFLFWAQLAAF